MGESFLNIYSLPIAKWSTECLEERLGQKSLYMPYTYDYDEIDHDMSVLSQIIGTPAPDLHL